MKLGSPKPFFIRAAELFGQIDNDVTPTMGKVWIGLFVKLEKEHQTKYPEPRTGKRKIQRPHKDQHRRVKERRKSRITD
jgi:hypothetical protein